MEEELDLASRAISTVSFGSPEIGRAWLAKVPEGDYHVRHGGKLVAFFRLLPVKHDRLMEFMEGQIRGGDITADDLEPFEPGKPIECILIGIASEPDVNELLRMHYVRMLLRGTMRELEKLGRKGVIITKLYGTSDTPTGIAMALHSGMTEYGPKLGQRLRFVMDLEKQNTLIFSKYKEGLAQWKRGQGKTDSKAGSQP